jgi:transposase
MEPRRGRPKKHELLVSPVQRAELERIGRQSRSARSVAFRARIVLECAGGASNAAVAAKLRTTGFTVGLWRNRFIAEGIAGLGDEPRPGAPREVGDEKVEQVVRLTMEKTPKGATHWSSRMLAARTGLSQSTISRIWRAFGLKPHRTESFQLSNDPLPITASPNPSSGLNPQTRSWPPSLASPLPLSPSTHPKLIREINDSGH